MSTQTSYEMGRPQFLLYIIAENSNYQGKIEDMMMNKTVLGSL